MKSELNEEVIKTAAAHDGPIETDAVVAWSWRKIAFGRRWRCSSGPKTFAP